MGVNPWQSLIQSIIDVTEDGLKKIESSSDGTEDPVKDFGFEGVNLRTSEVDFSDDELSDSD